MLKCILLQQNICMSARQLFEIIINVENKWKIGVVFAISFYKICAPNIDSYDLVNLYFHI